MCETPNPGPIEKRSKQIFQLIQVPLHVFESMSTPLLPCKLHQAC